MMALLTYIKLHLLLKILDNKKTWAILTYLPVSRITFIIIAIIKKFKMHKINVKTILLNCDVDEEV
jgi:hypothetical protein